MAEKLISKVVLMVVIHLWEVDDHQHIDEDHIQYGEIYDISLTFKERDDSFVNVFHVHPIERGPEADRNSKGLECK